MTSCIIRFLAGGILMLTVCIVSNRSASIGGILSALPIFSGAAFIINMMSKNSVEMLAQAKGGVVGMGIGLFFFAALYIAMYYHVKTEAAFGIGFLMMMILTSVTFCVGR